MPRAPKVEQTVTKNAEITGHSKAPLIFVSHDSQDADLAEAFGKLVGSVSAGVLKIFPFFRQKGHAGD